MVNMQGVFSLVVYAKFDFVKKIIGKRKPYLRNLLINIGSQFASFFWFLKKIF